MVEMAFLWIFYAEGGNNGDCKFNRDKQRLLKMCISDDRNTGFAVGHNTIEQKDEKLQHRILIRRLQTY